MDKSKGKGRALGRLMGGLQQGGGEPQELPLASLRPNPWQPRQDFDEEALRELAASIREHGLLQPVLVRPSSSGDDSYELVVGERRWRACQLVGLEKIPVKIRTVSDRQAALMALVENLQREDLRALDTAHGLRRLVTDFKLSHEQVGELLGKSRSTVSNLLRLLQLPDALRESLASGQLEMGHARALLGIAEPERQSALAGQVIRDALTVRETEALVRGGEAVAPRGAPVAKISKLPVKPRLDPDSRRLEERLSEHFGSSVQLHPNARGKAGGYLQLRYHNVGHLQEVLRRMGLPAEQPDGGAADWA